MITTLKLSRLVTIAGLGFATAAGSAWAATAAAPLHDHGAASGSPMLMAVGGKKWVADTTLSRAMTSIHGAVHAEFADVAALDDTLAGKELTRKALRRTYLALAKKINAEVAYVIGNCRLAPEADARLHLVIADLNEGVAAMEGQEEYGSRRDGVVKVMDALDRYAGYFDDPGFRSVHR